MNCEIGLVAPKVTLSERVRSLVPTAPRSPASYAVLLSSLALLVSILLLTKTSAASLNDTGQSACYDAANIAVPCSATVAGDAGTNPRQDARYGRDAAAGQGKLAKTGAGAAGFDFTKIANNGSALAASSILGSAAADWACTNDNVTGLVWEIKTDSGLRSRTHTYTWYSTAIDNGGDAGTVGTNTCGGTLAAYGNQCNTQNYVLAVNAATLCGANDWRLPTRRELLSIVHLGATNPTIDTTYFPNTIADWHWTSSTSASYPAAAWLVLFYYGGSYADVKTYDYVFVRLVRGAQ